MLPLDLFRAGRRGAATVSIIAIASTVACSDSATAPPPNQSKPATSALDPIFGKNSIVPPVVDGVLSPDEYKGAATLSFRVLRPPTVPGAASVSVSSETLFPKRSRLAASTPYTPLPR